MMRYRFLLLTPSLLWACAQTSPAPEAGPVSWASQADPEQQTAAQRPDPHSFSRPDQVRVTHMGLTFDIHFESRTLEGVAAMRVERVDPEAPLILDSRGLEIISVHTAQAELSADATGVPALALREEPIAWQGTTLTQGPEDPVLGRPLTISLPPGANLVQVRYRTSPEASGLQWLTPEQTAGKKHPFLYSQSQAIHGRSWIPCQDSPGVRVTYDARVRVAAPHVAVMAAEMLDAEQPHQQGDQREFRFTMQQPVPAYLIALGAGDLTRRELGPRTAVWADRETLEAAAHEFADVESMISSAEALYGPYRWGRYEILVLPPAFPFGGMENPRLTFATPTILAGDRSLVTLVAHELAHSWSGNLVTNATWEDLWLNEGFTVYFERRIMEAIYGKERAEMEAALGRQDLERQLTDDLVERPEDQRLHINLQGRDPDDGFSEIPYEKGALFLRALEEAYGRDAFDAFLRGWFNGNAFGSVSTADFVAYLETHLLGRHEPLPGKTPPNVDLWINGPGLPAESPNPQAPAFAEVSGSLQAWLAGEVALTTLPSASWTAHEWLHFLRGLPRDLDAERMGQLDETFQLTQSSNAEIVAEWLRLAALVRYEPAFSRLEDFLLNVGRRKFLVPLYRALLATEDGTAQARQIYQRARPGYHAISTGTLDELLAWEG